MTNDYTAHRWLTTSLRALAYILTFVTAYLLLQGFFSFSA